MVHTGHPESQLQSFAELAVRTEAEDNTLGQQLNSLPRSDEPLLSEPPKDTRKRKLQNPTGGLKDKYRFVFGVDRFFSLVFGDGGASFFLFFGDGTGPFFVVF
jgi:hypothetical protein